MQMIAAQAADALLEMKGIDAAFAAGSEPGRTVISARSLGTVNVQTIMEKMGGGGHVNVAAAQISEPSEIGIQQIVSLLRSEGLLGE